jgi:hypothetical protein
MNPPREWPFQGQLFYPLALSPGLRPGLTEPAFQAEKDTGYSEGEPDADGSHAQRIVFGGCHPKLEL